MTRGPGGVAVAALVLALAQAHPVRPQDASRPAGTTSIDSLRVSALIAARAPSGIEWAVTGAALIGAVVLDEEVESIGLERDSSWVGLSRAANRVGRPSWFLPALGGTWALGYVLDSPEISQGALRAGAGLLASGVVNGLGKTLVGRRRPDEPGATPGEFRPMNPSDNDWQSFPSGHTVIAFSLATSLAEEFDQPVVTLVGYLMAGTVGWSRLYDNKHWMSDVVAGAAIGTFVTRYTVRTLKARERQPGEAAALVLTADGIAVTIPLR